MFSVDLYAEQLRKQLIRANTKCFVFFFLELTVQNVTIHEAVIPDSISYFNNLSLLIFLL